MDLNKLYVYDIEIFPNTFSICLANAGQRQLVVFEISDRKDERELMMKYLRKVYKEGAWMVGYNNLSFDYPVLHYILKNHQWITVSDIYDFAMNLIKTQNEDRFANIIYDRDQFIKQIDLMKVHHFDNSARMTSLKVLEFNMLSDNIEDLPFPVGTELTNEQKDILVAYNKHDVKETVRFLEHSMNALEFREKLSEEYGKSFMSHNDGKIGKDYFIMKLEEEIPGSCYMKDDNGKRVVRQTKRKQINLSECIFPYVQFKRPEFIALHEWLKSQTIKETKGVFTDILESDLGDVVKYAQLTLKRKLLGGSPPSETKLKELRKKQPCGEVVKKTLKSGKVNYYWEWNIAESLNVVVDGLTYVLGTGGIHASVESQILRSDDEYVIEDWDVASYYPNMAISNRIYPEHLGEGFCDIYRDVYDQRKSYPKGTPENAMLKLALNSVYGDSNSMFSPFYDPKYTMSITVGGQLSLCMLAEMLLDVESLQIIQVNTDGLTYRVRREHRDEAHAICHEWEKIVKLELEVAEYELMAIRDVNSYIAKYTSGKIKRKGAYAYMRPQSDNPELGWHQNHSALIVPMAAEQALLHDEDISYFIKQHRNKYDFMLRGKVPRSSRLVMDTGYGDIELANTIRYYVSEAGEGELVKIMPPLENKRKTRKVWRGLDARGNTVEKETLSEAQERPMKEKNFELISEELLPPEERRISINAGWKVKDCSNIKNFQWDINYEYYIQECRKLVDPLMQ